MDLLAEVRGAFANDAVWLIHLEPIHGYDPLIALGPKTEASKGPNGQAVVKPEFFNTPYGGSSLADIRLEPAAQAARKPVNPKAPAGASGITANAVRIKGYWRENPKSQNIVSELLKSLREKSVSLSFAVKDPKDAKRTIDLLDDQNLGKILLITSVAGKNGELAQPFEITLPLTREISIK